MFKGYILINSLLAINFCCCIIWNYIHKKHNFFFTSSTLRRWNRWEQLSFSYWPVCLAKTAASLRISAMASQGQPPNDSTARGMNLMPCLLQSSRAHLFFLLTATSRAWPGLAAAPTRVAAWRGEHSYNNPTCHPYKAVTPTATHHYATTTNTPPTPQILYHHYHHYPTTTFENR